MPSDAPLTTKSAADYVSRNVFEGTRSLTAADRARLILSEQAFIELGWMSRANDDGCGLYAPSVSGLGRVEPADECVAAGFATFEWDRGYWITDVGREALKNVQI